MARRINKRVASPIALKSYDEGGLWVGVLEGGGVADCNVLTIIGPVTSVLSATSISPQTVDSTALR